MSEVLNRPVTTSQDSAPVRPDRQDILAFVTDAATESALRDALADATPRGLDVRRADVRGAIAVLRKMASPKTLIIDISGEEQPLTALDDLSHVVEPDIRVLLLGDREDANFYRQVTKGLGVLEYIHKPAQRDMIARYFGPLLTEARANPQTVNGGRVVSITGVRGGVGASTVASNLAWHYGVEANRHTVVLDSDLHRGTCAMLLGARTGQGLRTALETPARIDELFVERAAQPAMSRLHVLAGEEKLAEQPAYAAGATTKLLDALRRRYNFVVVDLPFSGMQMHRDLLMLAHHRVLVMDPTLASVRDTLRLLALPNAPMQPRRPVLVLNRLGHPGTLQRRQVEDALKMPVDVVIQDLPKLVGEAATLGEPAAAKRGAFRNGILDLAREVAVLRMNDGPGGGLSGSRVRPRRFGFLKVGRK